MSSNQDNASAGNASQNNQINTKTVGTKQYENRNNTDNKAGTNIQADDTSAVMDIGSDNISKSLNDNVIFNKIAGWIKDFDPYYLLAPACILIVVMIFGAFTGIWPWKPDQYNSFALQANSWLHGSLSLIDGEIYTYLELAIKNGEYFVSFPPFPSYVLLPFSVFCGINTPDGYITLAFAMIGALYAYKLCKAILGEDRRETSFLLAMIIYLGSNTLFFTVTSWVWFMAQTMSFTLTILAFYYAVKGSPGWSLAFWAMAVGCRPFQILFLPVLLILMIRTWKMKEEGFTFAGKLKKEWYKGIPCLLIAMSYCILNYARFGSIVEFGHNYLPEFVREENGQFSLEYLMPNLGRMFRLPVMTPENGDRFNFYNADGIALWLVNPVLLLLVITLIYKIIKARNKDTFIAVLIFVLACVHVVILCMHRTLGGWHFGNRYTCDMLPAVLVGVLLTLPEDKRFMVVPRLIFIFGFALNLVGTVATYNYWI